MRIDPHLLAEVMALLVFILARYNKSLSLPLRARIEKVIQSVAEAVREQEVKPSAKKEQQHYAP